MNDIDTLVQGIMQDRDKAPIDRAVMAVAWIEQVVCGAANIDPATLMVPSEWEHKIPQDHNERMFWHGLGLQRDAEDLADEQRLRRFIESTVEQHENAGLDIFNVEPQPKRWWQR